MINPDDLQQIKLVSFNGAVTYNTQGYAVLPEYEIKTILASVQALSKSEIRFLPEGTHYADYINIFTDYPVDVDNSPTNLGDYFIWKNNVYKIYSAQNYQNFENYSTNHIETTVARDNRITYNGSIISIPFPQIDSTFAPLFDLISMAASCFTSPELTILWGFQQELRPDFPYCMVNIDAVENLEGTNYDEIDLETETLYTSQSKCLLVTYHFYAYDKIQVFTLMEKFKLNRVNFNFSSDKISFMGFTQESNKLNEELYENRTIFHGGVQMRFGLIVQQTQESTQTIDFAAYTLSLN